MSRGWLWLQLAVAWLPMWALFAALIAIVHGLSVASASMASLRMIGPGALLGFAVYRFASRTPWPHPFRIGFVGIHVLAASAYSLSWFVFVTLVNSIIRGGLTMTGPGVGLFLMTGIWLYIVVAGVAYNNLAAQRTAMMQAHAARMQLDAMRSQLHPHFLFNALHTVVQLIPIDPHAAVGAAEQLAAALRTTIEEQRDLVPLAEEWAFVERYLSIESIRFGDRLVVQASIDPSASELLLPSFALQTLVENAVRHGAAPRVEPTMLRISATESAGVLTVKVADDGIGANIADAEQKSGTGLRRLRERMRWLYGDRARLDIVSEPGRGYAACLVVPQLADGSAPFPGSRDDGH